MALIVQKYGGTSVADASRIKGVADRIMVSRARGHDVVAVVSAMGDTTDLLTDLAYQVCDHPDQRELDLLLSTGEIVSSALLAMALRHLGQDAVSLSGSQAGILTERNHGRARITSIEPRRIERELSKSRVVIVAGFQGVTQDMDVTTLGRGGSDTTAVALAARLGADRCERFTDVEGVFTADPHVVPEARKLKDISYDEMLELASFGAKVMHPRAVELGAVHRVPIFVASSFNSAPGTLIHGGVLVEVARKVRGIAHDLDITKVTIRGVPDRPGGAAAIFQPLSAVGVRIDTVVQNASVCNVTDVSFTVSQSDLNTITPLVESLVANIGAQGWSCSSDFAKVSIVGAALASGPGYAAGMFTALHQAGINIELITTSQIRVTCIIDQNAVSNALNALHRAFRLDTAEE